MPCGVGAKTEKMLSLVVFSEMGIVRCGMEGSGKKMGSVNVTQVLVKRVKKKKKTKRAQLGLVRVKRNRTIVERK